jgi:hypothetical protein
LVVLIRDVPATSPRLTLKLSWTSCARQSVPCVVLVVPALPGNQSGSICWKRAAGRVIAPAETLGWSAPQACVAALTRAMSTTCRLPLTTALLMVVSIVQARVGAVCAWDSQRVLTWMFCRRTRGALMRRRGVLFVFFLSSVFACLVVA